VLAHADRVLLSYEFGNVERRTAAFVRKTVGCSQSFFPTYRSHIHLDIVIPSAQRKHQIAMPPMRTPLKHHSLH